MTEQIIRLHIMKARFEMMDCWFMAEVIGKLIEEAR